jgi:PIN domain nuclease of toxin-antitoxin system
MRAGRYLVDTNVALYWLFNQKELEGYVHDILGSFNGLFFISTVSVQEIIHLYTRGNKLETPWKRPEEILPTLDATGWELLPVKRDHLATFATLNPKFGHNDPSDHVIVSQAIAERLTLISSDLAFEFYTTLGLSLLFNVRG